MECGSISGIGHRLYLADWEKAMRYGLMDGRAFSESTVMVYTLYAKWFMERFDAISISNLKRALLEIPPEKFAKRFKLYQALNSYAKYLIEEEAMDAGYLEKAKAFKPRRHLPPKRTTVAEQGISNLLAQCDKPMDSLLVTLLSSTGLRVTEAASLQAGDIDFNAACLTVKLAKWGKTRRIGLSGKTVQLLQDYMSQRPVGIEHDFIFVKANGKPIDRYGIRTRLEKLGRKAGVEVTPHALRRAFVTINANKGRPLPMLQIACGHSNITTTRSYCLTSEDETVEAMKGWD